MKKFHPRIPEGAVFAAPLLDYSHPEAAISSLNRSNVSARHLNIESAIPARRGKLAPRSKGTVMGPLNTHTMCLGRERPRHGAGDKQVWGEGSLVMTDFGDLISGGR